MFWIKITNQLIASEVFQDQSLWQLYSFIASKTVDKKCIFKGVEINPGQYLCSLNYLAETCHTCKTRIIARLKRLSELGAITMTTHNVGTIITVCNIDSNTDETIDRTTDSDVDEGIDRGITRGIDGGIDGGITRGITATPKKEVKEVKEVKELKDLNNSLSSRPTVEKIQAYLDEKQITDVDAEQFWNFYESKGWMVGKTPMKNWHAAIATWHRRGNTAKPSNTINTINTSNPFNTINTLPYGTTVNRIDLQAKQRNETIRRAIDALKSGAITIDNNTDFLNL